MNEQKTEEVSDAELEAVASRLRLDADLAALQERILAGAMELGHDGTTFPLYQLVVALRRYIGAE